MDMVVKAMGNAMSEKLSILEAFDLKALSSWEWILVILVSMSSLLSMCFSTTLLSTSFSTLAFFCPQHHNIPEYSNRVDRMNSRHMMSHLTNAEAPSWGLGALLLTLFKVLIIQRNRVRSRPSRPGIASCGTIKLICKELIIFRPSLKNISI